MFTKIEKQQQKKQQQNNTKQQNNIKNNSSVVEWLKHRTDDQHGLGSKPICAILLCPWERHFTHFLLLGGLDKQF